MNRAQTVCLVILTVIAVGFALIWLKPVMIPFVLAVFIWLALSSMVDVMIERLRVPRPLALPITLIVGLVASVFIGTLISASVSQLSESAPVYIRQFTALMSRVAEVIPPQLRSIDALQVDNLTNFFVNFVSSLLARTTNAVVAILSQSFLVAIFVVFMAMGGGGGERPSGAWAEIEHRIKTYLLLKAIISAVTGLIVGGILYLLDVPLALVFGLFAFLLNFIPNIGSVIATLLPLPVVIGSPELGVPSAVLALVLPGVVQMLVGNILEPKLMGDSLDLHPVVVLIALIVWGMLWGIVGMLLAAPITAMLKILLEQSDGGRPIADLMAGRLDALRSPRPRAPSAS